MARPKGTAQASGSKRKARSGGKGLQPFYIVLGVVGLIGIAAIAYAATRSGGGEMAVDMIDPVALGSDARVLYEKAEPITLGSDDAPAKLVVFSDFMCPACATFATRIEPLLRERYIRPGRLQLTYFDFPLGGQHVHSFLAARAARCAGDQGKFWEYHDLLFARQQTWSYDRTPDRLFVEYAGEANLDTRRFEDCLRSERFAEQVTASRLLGDQYGINATPTVLVNGRRVRDWTDIDAYAELIGAEAGETEPVTGQ